MNIPITNVYYLLCYAWGHAEESDVVRLEDLQGLTRVQDLLGHLLATGTLRLVRRGLARGYREVREDLAGIRGKVALSDTAARGLRARGRVACDFGELSHDVLHNRILRSTLAALLRIEDLDRDVRDRIRLGYRTLEGVSVVRLSQRLFGQVQLDRNRRRYRLLLSVCRLVHERLLVDETSGARFTDFRKDQARMWKLFEDFAIGFFRHEQRHFRVNRGGRAIQWDDEGTAERHRSAIPRMKGDVLLDSRERRIILDTKYYAAPLAGRYGARKLPADNLYQLLAYLRNREATTAPGPRHEGILLYPAVKERLAIDLRLEGFSIRARAVDLAQPWSGIHRDMLALTGN